MQEWFRTDRMLGDLGRLAIEAANVKPGFRVIDVGCGTGGSTFDAAGVVGDHGRVLGIDQDPKAISVAKARSLAEGYRNVELVVGDAARYGYPASNADAVISRFGNLFFSDTARAHSNLAGALRSGGRISFVAPRELERNMWAALPMRVVSRVTGKNTLSTAPFALADPRRIVTVLERAGFERIRMETIDTPLCVGADLDDAIAFFVKGEGRDVFSGLDSPKTQELLESLTRALSPYVGEHGVYMPSSVWLVSARVR
jgi:ubiquinone/menaquinone biosynthesis C-methylase UbiE